MSKAMDRLTLEQIETSVSITGASKSLMPSLFSNSSYNFKNGVFLVSLVVKWVIFVLIESDVVFWVKKLGS